MTSRDTAERMMGMSDPRDVRAAFHSLRQVITVA